MSFIFTDAPSSLNISLTDGTSISITVHKDGKVEIAPSYETFARCMYDIFIDGSKGIKINPCGFIEMKPLKLSYSQDNIVNIEWLEDKVPLEIIAARRAVQRYANLKAFW